MAAVGSVHDEAVPPLIRKAAAWSWRLLVIVALAVALLWVIQRLELIVVPVALALMLTALMIPAVDFLDRRGAPRGGAVALVLLSGIAIVGGMLTFVVSQFVTGLPGLVEQVTHSIETTRTWLIEGPAHLSKDQITNAGNSAIEALRNNQAKLTSGALSTAATVTEIVTGALLVLFTLIFFLHGGRNIWQFVTKIFPPNVQERVRDAGRAGFQSLDRLCARDVSRRAGRRRRHRYRAGHHGCAAGAAVGLAGLPRCLHPVGRCRYRRVPRRRRRTARQRLRLRADHARRSSSPCSNWKATCCSRW